jgi:RNA polymerase sigma-70 factor, ECF subfamily
MVEVDHLSDPWIERVRQAYDATHQPLWQAVLAFSRSEDIADEAVAEGFAQALRRGDDIRNVERWVWAATFAIARGLLAERSRGNSVPLSQDPSVDPVEPDVDLISALSRLGDRDREVVLMCDFAGWPAFDVAAITGISPGGVRVRLHRARKRLRTLLSEKGQNHNGPL